ncbi:MAG: outer membrane lipoprotein carrier protein LolA [bacterium]
MILIFAAPAFAESRLSHQERLDLESRFSQKQKETRFLKTEFRQTLQLEGLNKPVVSRGEFFFQAPDRLKLEYTQPAGELALLRDGALVLKKNGRLLVKKQLQSSQAVDSVALLQRFFTDLTAGWDEDYDVSVWRRGEKIAVVLERKGEPQRGQPAKIETLLTGRDLELQSVRVALGEGNELFYEFFNVRRNASFDEAIFAWPKEDNAPRRLKQKGGR